MFRVSKPNLSQAKHRCTGRYKDDAFGAHVVVPLMKRPTACVCVGVAGAYCTVASDAKLCECFLACEVNQTDNILQGLESRAPFSVPLTLVSLNRAGFYSPVCL